VSNKSRLKAVYILLAGLSLGFLGLVAVLSWYVNTDHFRSLLLGQLNRMIPGSVAVTDHHLALNTGELFLSNATIQDQNADELIRIDFLSIDLRPLALFRKIVMVESVKIEHPQLRLKRDGAGRLNLVGAFATDNAQGAAASSVSDAPFKLIVRHLSLSDGYVIYSEAGKKRQMTLQGVDIFANGDLSDRSGVVKLGIGKSCVAFKGKTIQLDQFDLALALRKGHIEPLVIKAHNQFASLLAYGDIYDAFSDPDVDLTLDVAFDLGETEAFFGYGQGDTGHVNALLQIKGQPNNPRVSLAADFDGGTLAGRPVGPVMLEAQLIDRVASLAQLSADASGGQLALSGQVDWRQVFPQGFLLPPGDWEESAFNGSLRIESLDLSAIELGANSLSGRMDALMNVKGKGMSMETLSVEASTMIAIEEFQSGGMHQPTGIRSRLDGRVQAGTLWIDVMEVEAADAHASARGSVDLRDEMVDAGFSIETHEVTPLLSLFGLSQVKGAVAVQGRLAGRTTNPVFNISSTSHDVRFNDIDVGNIMLEAALSTTGRLDVSRLTVDNKGSSLRAEGEMQLFARPFELHPNKPLNARLVLSNVAYSDFFSERRPDSNINGLLGGEIVLAGSLRSLEARADVLAKDVAVDQIRLGDLSGKATLLNGKLSLAHLRLTNNHTDLEARGEIQLLHKGAWQTFENPAFWLELIDGRIALADFQEELSGELRLDTHLEGHLKAPRGNITLKGDNLDLGVQRLETLTLDVRAEDRQATIERLDVVMPGGGLVSGAGQVAYDRTFQFSLQTHGLLIESIDQIREIAAVGGQLDIDIQGRGLIHRPEIKGEARWKNIQVRDEVIEDLQLRFSLKDNRLSLNGQQTFDLSAGYDLSNKAFSMDLMMDDTFLAPWFAIVGRPELGGRINGSIRAEGNVRDLKRTRATFDVPKLVLELNGEPITETNGLSGTFNNGEFKIPGFKLDVLGQGNLVVQGAGDIFGDIEIAAEGEIPLKAANVFVPDLQGIKGRLLIMTFVNGPLSGPKLEGTIEIKDGGFRIPELQQTISAVNGQMTFAAGEDVMGRFGGMLDDGRFDLDAKIALDGFSPTWIDAHMTATALPFKIPQTMEMLLSADLAMQGSPEDILVNGEIVLLEGLYYKNFKLNLLEAVQVKEREDTPPTVKEVNALLKPLRFDIHLKHRQSFVVDNNIADMDINPDFVLQGTPENPILTGSAQVADGTITYQNKVFEVQKGAVDFVSPYKTEAQIDIKGTVDIRDWQITISLYGPPDRLKVELSSVPSEEDADIISLLAFNKTTYELNEGGSGVEQSPTVLLSRLLAASFGEDIKKSTGIDLLEVEAESAQDNDSTDRIKVTVGKDLSERMTVKYSVESNDGGYVHRAATEYKLLEYFLVSGFQDTKGTYGGEFIFRIRFRLFR
jgi:translocation and assembly module TamB